MRKFNFLTNKYSISVLILLVCMGIDILLHKGMSRVMIPESFTDKIEPFTIQPSPAKLNVPGKEWIKAVNSIEALNSLDSSVAGFECDLYFDDKQRTFFVYHDSAAISNLLVDELLQVYKEKNLQASIWFDIKNLQGENCNSALIVMDSLFSRYHLKDKTIIESPDASCLSLFRQNDFFTSYYVPFFNPYQVTEKSLISFMDSMAAVLKKYPASALSGYYFQYPVLKKFFPNYPLLTWADHSRISIVSWGFNRHLLHDTMVKVILYNKPT